METKLVNVYEYPRFFDFAIETIFCEWGDGDINHLNKKKEKLKNSKNKNCYVLVVDNTPVGCFVICKNDIKGHPEFNPNLACVCIAKEYRGKGYANLLLEMANETFLKLDIKKAYLKTTLNGFYEKFGWVFVKKIKVENNTEKIYCKNFQGGARC